MFELTIALILFFAALIFVETEKMNFFGKFVFCTAGGENAKIAEPEEDKGNILYAKDEGTVHLFGDDNPKVRNLFGNETEYLYYDPHEQAQNYEQRGNYGHQMDCAVMRITITGDNGSPEYFVDVMSSDFPVTIGRGKCDVPGKNIVVDELSVSAQHVRIGVKNGIMYVCDCHSTCGTVINGKNGDATVLKSSTQNLAADIFSNNFELVLGRLRAKVTLFETARSFVKTGCRIVVRADYRGRTVQRAEFADNFTIGRQNTNVAVLDARMSRVHAVVRLTADGRFVLYDNKSMNGVIEASTRKPIIEYPLQPGTSLIMGDTVFTVENIIRGV